MNAAESLARSISDPITTEQTTENILHIRKLISRELEEMNLVFSDVCNAMKSKFSLTHENDIEFIHSRIDSIGELAENLAQQYEAQAGQR